MGTTKACAAIAALIAALDKMDSTQEQQDLLELLSLGKPSDLLHELLESRASKDK